VVTPANSGRIPQSCCQPFHRREAPREGMPSLKEMTRMVLANCYDHPKEREAHFQNSQDRLKIHFLHSSNAPNCINEKEIIIIIWPNHGDSDHVLIVTIDTDLGDG
jgi:hypothetical protein